MATLTIKNVPPKVVKSLKAMARRKQRSMSQEVRDLLETYIDRESALKRIEEGWAKQTRRPTAEEIDSWIEVGRP